MLHVTHLLHILYWIKIWTPAYMVYMIWYIQFGTYYMVCKAILGVSKFISIACPTRWFDFDAGGTIVPPMSWPSFLNACVTHTVTPQTLFGVFQYLTVTVPDNYIPTVRGGSLLTRHLLWRFRHVISGEISAAKIFTCIKRFVFEFQGESLKLFLSYRAYFRRYQHFRGFWQSTASSYRDC